MRIIALTRGRDVPSSRFRIRQCLPYLARDGFEIREFCPRVAQHVRLPGALGRVRRRYLLPIAAAQTLVNLGERLPAAAASRGADLAWVSRAFVPGLEETVGVLRCRRVLDVDDAVWLTTPRGPAAAAAFARRMDAVVAGNAYLAEWYGQHCGQVRIVPTAVDTARFRPAAGRDPRRPFTVGWMGTSGNFAQLEPVRATLERFLTEHPAARWLVVADARPPAWPADSSQHLFRRWSAAAEVGLMQEMDVGLMPLEDTDWTRGKCSYKMLQAMAVGLPVVVSPVGMNRDVLARGDCGRAARSSDDWYGALEEFHDDPQVRANVGGTGRRIVEQHYAVDVVARQLARAFREWGAP